MEFDIGNTDYNIVWCLDTTMESGEKVEDITLAEITRILSDPSKRPLAALYLAKMRNWMSRTTKILTNKT